MDIFRSIWLNQYNPRFFASLKGFAQEPATNNAAERNES